MKVIDRNGNETVHPDGYILKDGERVRIPVMMRDSNPGLDKAMADAQAIIRAAEFDAFRNHPQAARYGTAVADVTTLNPPKEDLDARKRREKQQTEAWKNPPSIVVASKRDTAGMSQSEARAVRTADAWKNPPSVLKGDASAQEQVAIVGASAPLDQLQAARDAAVIARDKRLEAAWQR